MNERIGFIGTGDPDGEGFAMAYRHAGGYRRLDGCELVACADVVPENAAAFAEEHGIPDRHVYEDYGTMLASAQPDVLSVTVPPGAHAEIVVDAARSGVPAAIHCEKPMALTWEDAKRMASVCERMDVQLTINHQLRFGKPYREAKRLLEDGAVGDLSRIEFREDNLFDAGTHSFDLANYFADHSPVEWVLGQVDYTEENKLFGAHNENQAIVQWEYGDGVGGLATTGRGRQFLGPVFRLLGTDGVIEIDDDGAVSYRQGDGAWRTVDTGVDGRYHPSPGTVRRGTAILARTVSGRVADRIEVPTYTERAIEEVVTALRRGDTSELNADRALAADELVFAAWESARRRGRVDLPLDIEDNPLESMVESDDLDPVATETTDG